MGGEVQHQQVVVTVHAAGHRLDGALQVGRRGPRVRAHRCRVVHQLDDAPLRIEALRQHLRHHVALAQEHVFFRVRREHDAVRIHHAGPLGRKRCGGPRQQRLLRLDRFLAQLELPRFRHLRVLGLPGPVGKLPRGQREQRDHPDGQRTQARGRRAEPRRQHEHGRHRPRPQREVQRPCHPHGRFQYARQRVVGLRDAEHLRHEFRGEDGGEPQGEPRRQAPRFVGPGGRIVGGQSPPCEQQQGRRAPQRRQPAAQVEAGGARRFQPRQPDFERRKDRQQREDLRGRGLRTGNARPQEQPGAQAFDQPPVQSQVPPRRGRRGGGQFVHGGIMPPRLRGRRQAAVRSFAPASSGCNSRRPGEL